MQGDPQQSMSMSNVVAPGGSQVSQTMLTHGNMGGAAGNSSAVPTGNPGSLAPSTWLSGSKLDGNAGAGSVGGSGGGIGGGSGMAGVSAGGGSANPGTGLQMPSAADISLMLSLGLGLNPSEAQQLANWDLQKLAMYLVSNF